MRAALTEPIFGSTKRRSRTRAVLTHGGGSARICASSIFPEASSFFSSALAVRTSFACSSARSRCSRDLLGTPAPALLSDTLRFSSQTRSLAQLLGHGREQLPRDRGVALDERPEFPRRHAVAEHVGGGGDRRGAFRPGEERDLPEVVARADGA